MSEQPLTSILCPTLIGRDAQYGALLHLLAQACAGQGQIVLISGEAGIGKSRLVMEVKRQAVQQDLQILQGRCFETDRVFPYAPLLDLLRTHIAGRTAADLEPELGSAAAELVKLSPELRTLLPQIVPLPPLYPEPEKRRLFTALAQFCLGFVQPQTLSRSPTRALPSDAPWAPCLLTLLIIVEDIHWADDTSLEFLLFLARQIATYPILLVMTYRNDEISTSLGRLLAALDRERLASEVTLPRLTMSETEAMLRAIFALSRRAQADFLEALYALTEGNPFFTEEVLQSCVAAGEIFQLGGQWGRKPLSQLHIPRTVQLAVRQRVEQLSPAARRLLTLAAVAGQRCDFGLLLQVTGQDEVALIEAMKELLAAQLVVEESADRFAFRHALTREAVYAGLLARERRSLHRSLGEALEQIDAAAPDTKVADPSTSLNASLAYHFYEAGVWDKTLNYARRAGEQAQALYAPRAAVEQFTRALEAIHHLTPPGTLGAPLQIEEEELYRARGQAYETLGEFEAARADLEQVLALARATHKQRTEWQGLFDLGFLWTSRDFARVGDYLQQALAAARGLGDTATLAHSLNRVGNWYVNTEQPQEGRRYHEEALTLFQALNDQRGLAVTIDLLAGAAHFGGHMQQGMAYYAQAAERFRAMGDRRGLASSLCWLVHQGPTLFNTGLAIIPLAACMGAGEEALHLAREISWRSGEAFAMFALAFCLGAQGEYGRALALAHSGLEITQALEHGWSGAGHNVLGVLYLDLFAIPTAHQHLVQSRALSQAHSLVFGSRLSTALLAATHLAQRELDDAASLLATELGSTPKGLPGDAEAVPTLAERLCWLVRAQWALQSGDPATALQIVDALITFAQQQATNAEPLVPVLSRIKGETLAALRRLDEAETALLSAQQTAIAYGARPQLWRIQVALGNLYKAHGQRSAAEAQFSAARSLIEALAATLSDTPLRDGFLHHALALLPSPPTLTPLRAARQEFAGLTERERTVAAFIAQGKSDREIAEILVLSKRTVSTHVGNILTKLGFSSRSQIAAWAVVKGL